MALEMRKQSKPSKHPKRGKPKQLAKAAQVARRLKAGGSAATPGKNRFQSNVVGRKVFREKIIPELALHFAIASHENAALHLKAAGALFDAGLHGPARSMAIS